MRLLYIFLFFLFSNFIHAQKLGTQIISTMGRSFETESVSLHVSIGEPFNTILENGMITVSQGVLQVLIEEGETSDTTCENATVGTLFFEKCDDGVLYFFVRTTDGIVYDPYYADGVSIDHTSGELPVTFNFVDTNFGTPCSIAEKAILITCIEAASSFTTVPLLKKTKVNAEFSVYPNPSKDQVQVALGASTQKEVLLQLFDLQGKLLLQRNGMQHEDQIDISNLPKGMYHLSITDELQQRKTIKLIKQ